VIALIGGLLVLIALIIYLTSGRNPEQDRLTQNEFAQDEQRAQRPMPEKFCTSSATFNIIKQQLFQSAAEVRGSDKAAYERIAATAALRMENPVMESQDSSTGAVNCSGSASLDLPPGLAVAGGRSTLTADIDYTVQPARDAGPAEKVVLRNADPIVTPLATLARASAPRVQPGVESGVPATGEQQQNVAASESANKPVGPQTNYPGRPSFDCSHARSKGEITVCSDSGLSALDVNMAAQYRRALAFGSPEQQALLKQTGNRFIAYRDRCPDTHCAAEAYLGRMREIRDIMEGRWQPPR
jgi:uncharacterized protein YecT (DUF1311 family)